MTTTVFVQPEWIGSFEEDCTKQGMGFSKEGEVPLPGFGLHGYALTKYHIWNNVIPGTSN